MELSRFWDKVQIKEHNECWDWKAYKTQYGYGDFKINGRTEKAHRVAYQSMFGVIPVGMCVLHKCDNPACCNPDHLGLGTHADNVADRVQKGRSANGEQNGRSKLTVSDIHEIRCLFQNNVFSAPQLAKLYNMDLKQIKNIVFYVHWRVVC